jgi:hypothetical protein
MAGQFERGNKSIESGWRCYVERVEAMEHVKEMLIEYSDMKRATLN